MFAAGVLLPRLPAVTVAIVGTAAACAVELSQLTPIPARIEEAVPGARLLLGTHFSVADLAWLLVGGAAAGLVMLRRLGHGGGTWAGTSSPGSPTPGT